MKAVNNNNNKNKQDNNFSPIHEPVKTPRSSRTSRKSILNSSKSWIDLGELTVSPKSAKQLLRMGRNLSYNEDENFDPLPRKNSKWKHIKKGSIAFLKMLAQKKNSNPDFNFTTHTGTALPEQSIDQIKALNSDIKLNLGFKALKLGPVNGARQVGYSPNGGKYYEDIRTQETSMFRKATPEKTIAEEKPLFYSPHRLQFKTKDSNGLEKIGPLTCDPTCRVKKFEYTVTKADILKRIGKKRACSQRKLFDNVSAYEHLKEIGLILTELQKNLNFDGHDFHLSHCVADSFGGPHEKSNIDPMTAGANYSTLFRVEEPIRKMLFDGYDGYPPVESVHIKGEILYAKEKDVPFEGTYNLTWGDGHKLVIYIDPLSDRKPAYIENLAAKFNWAIEMKKNFSNSTDESSDSTEGLPDSAEAPAHFENEFPLFAEEFSDSTEAFSDTEELSDFTEFSDTTERCSDSEEYYDPIDECSSSPSIYSL